MLLAVRLQFMTTDVTSDREPPPLRQAQTALTEERVVAAATDLFLSSGYIETTLEAVAKAARVGVRTVYVRFGTKAELFKRVVDVAIVGDIAPVDVLGRDWMQLALTAPTAAERIAAAATAGRQIMERSGALFAVALQAAAIEPAIQEAFQEGRRGARRAQEVFWTAMADDGLLPAGADVAWLIDTTGLLGSAETYLQAGHLYGWSYDQYEEWIATTWTRLAAASAGPATPG
jgi:AcrR family transcriptional regulator